MLWSRYLDQFMVNWLKAQSADCARSLWIEVSATWKPNSFMLPLLERSYMGKKNRLSAFLNVYILQQVWQTKQKKEKSWGKETSFSRLSRNYCSSPSLSLQLLFVRHVRIYFRVDWWSDLNTIGDVAWFSFSFFFYRRYFILNAEMGIFSVFCFVFFGGGGVGC